MEPTLIGGNINVLVDVPPSSHLMKVQKYSLLGKYGIERYESSVFQVGGYQWRLVFYPRGKKEDGGKDYVSLYLLLEDPKSLPSNFEVNVELKMFVHNPLKKKYLMVQSVMLKRFNAEKTELGIAQLIPLATFNDPKNGYLMDDSCSLGADFSVIRPAPLGKTECLTMIEKPEKNKITWKITKFSTIDRFDHHSHEFVIGQRNWKIAIHPKGCMDGKGNSLSAFLMGFGFIDNTPQTKTYAKFRLRLLDQHHGRHLERESWGWYPIYPYTGFGFPKFISLQELHNPSRGFLVDDTLYIGVEVDVVSMTKYC